MPRQDVPINGEVLAWAMEQAGVSDAELARVCHADVDDVVAWREGEAKPGKTQFTRLAARLRQPAAVFFLREAPDDDPLLAAFRHPPGRRGARDLLDEEFRAIRTAERLRDVTQWVRERTNARPGDLPMLKATQPAAAARAAREVLDWKLSYQTKAKTSAEVSALLRARLEGIGVLVLQMRMGREGCRGFTLYNETAPVIVANSAYTTEARIFSFLHEFAHILRGRSSICSRVPDTGIENWCENFAAAFLMPRTPFVRFVNGRFGDEQIATTAQVATIARHFRVSLRATAVRLERLDLAAEDLYDKIDSEADFKASGGFSRDNAAAAVRLREWGRSYASTLLQAEERGLLGRTDVLEYLNVSNAQLTEVRSRLRSTDERED